ncbi:MAG: hypothetical protein RR482_03045 [Clostridia bacterium]
MSEKRWIQTYTEWIEALNTLGFMLFSGDETGLLTLGTLTHPDAWHTGDQETDPWAWKDRLVAEHRGVCARILHGRQTFVSFAWYPHFLAAFRPETSLEVRYAMGVLDATTWRMAQLFQTRSEWARHELTRALDVTGKEKARFDRALTALQREMAITASGQTQRTAYNGAPMGWPSMTYMRTEVWARPEDLEAASCLSKAQALTEICARARQISPQWDARAGKKLFGGE